jgi:hypothetical protein
MTAVNLKKNIVITTNHVQSNFLNFLQAIIAAKTHICLFGEFYLYRQGWWSKVKYLLCRNMTKRNLLLIGFILLKFSVQSFLISPEYDLHRDEYLHLDQAQHLAWGYLSVPPVTAWISYLIFLLGNSVFWIKFFPSLFGALTLLVVWKTIEELKGDTWALVVGASCILFSALLRINMLYQPNSLDILCWTTFYFTFIKYINSENKKWLYTAAVVFAIGFLNKYNVAFLAIGLIPAILLTEHRRILLRKELYIASIILIVLIAPNLIWQYQNHFPVIHHMKELAEKQLVHVERAEFLKTQMLFFTGALPAIITSLIAMVFFKPFKPYRVFLLSFIFTLMLFVYFRAKAYYAIGLYPIYIGIGSGAISMMLKERAKKFMMPLFTLLPVLFFLYIYPFAFPNKDPKTIVMEKERYQKLGLLRWEDGKDHLLPQDFADMLGWKELAQKVDRIYSLMPEQEKTFVLCDNYGQAGAINYYTTKGIKAVSFNADYIEWFDFTTPHVNFIRVKEHEDSETEMEETSRYFERTLPADSITNSYAREFGTTIFGFVHSKIDINKRLKEELEKEKKNRN